MHISLPIGKGNILMANDALESMGHKVSAGTNFHMFLSPESEEEANKLLGGLSEGRQVAVPLAKMFWGA